jgi:hypothetical protein
MNSNKAMIFGLMLKELVAEAGSPIMAIKADVVFVSSLIPDQCMELRRPAVGEIILSRPMDFDTVRKYGLKHVEGRIYVRKFDVPVECWFRKPCPMAMVKKTGENPLDLREFVVFRAKEHDIF